MRSGAGTAVLSAGCDFDVQIADFSVRERGVVVSLECEGHGFDNLPFSFLSRIGAPHDPKARHPKAPIATFGIVSIFDTKSHDHLAGSVDTVALARVCLIGTTDRVAQGGAEFKEGSASHALEPHA